jgi:hypothetical protein
MVSFVCGYISVRDQNPDQNVCALLVKGEFVFGHIDWVMVMAVMLAHFLLRDIVQFSASLRADAQ